MTDEAFGLHKIGQILVPISDLERATAFYRDVLGMTFLFAYPGIAFFDCDGVRLYLAKPADEWAGKPTLYFTVPDVEDAYATLVGRGAASESEPPIAHREATYELHLAFVRDPDGNHIGLMAEVPTAAA